MSGLIFSFISVLVCNVFATDCLSVCLLVSSVISVDGMKEREREDLDTGRKEWKHIKREKKRIRNGENLRRGIRRDGDGRETDRGWRGNVTTWIERLERQREMNGTGGER